MTHENFVSCFLSLEILEILLINSLYCCYTQIFDNFSFHHKTQKAHSKSLILSDKACKGVALSALLMALGRAR